jgi:multiple sugar transport system permease protein
MRTALERAAICLAIIVAMVPLAWMVETSFKSNKEIGQDGTLYPHHPTFENYRGLFSANNFGSFLWNSVGITALSVLAALVLGSLAAYSLARYRTWRGGGKYIALALLTARIIPPIVIIVPVFLLVASLHALDSWTALIVLYAAFNVSIVVWMMESFFREIPVDLEEAAMVDGDSRLTAFRRIVLPLAGPGLVATAIFCVVLTYNEFLFALILTSTPKAETMPVGTSTLIGRIDTDYGAMAAAGVLGALPIIAFALLVQRHLVRGLTLGAVK